MEGAEEELAEAAAEPVAEVAEEREPAEEVPAEEPLEAGELEADLLSIGAEEAISPAAQEAGVAAEEAALDMGFDAEELELPELEPVSETGEGEEVAQRAPVAEAEEEIDLTDIAADLEEVGVETELAAEAGRTEAGEVSEEEVLAASGQLDLSDLEEDLDLSEVLEEVAWQAPNRRLKRSRSPIWMRSPRTTFLLPRCRWSLESWSVPNVSGRSPLRRVRPQPMLSRCQK